MADTGGRDKDKMMDQLWEAQGKVGGDLTAKRMTKKSDIFQVKFGDEVSYKVGVLGDTGVAGEGLCCAKGRKIESNTGNVLWKTV